MESLFVVFGNLFGWGLEWFFDMEVSAAFIMWLFITGQMFGG